MIKFVIYGALIFAVIALIVLVIKCIKGKRFVIRQFERCNCIVFGKKGTGKDLLFNLAINGRKNLVTQISRIMKNYAKLSK